MPKRCLVGMSVVFAVACATGGTRPSVDGGASSVDSGITARDSGREGGARDGGPLAPVDAARRVDAGFDAGMPPRDSGGPQPSSLDPDLDLADPSGAPCDFPGQDCPGIAMCRFYSATENRCESCDACGNLGARCVDGTDCDILFACYAGRCTNICPLNTYACGEPCLDVGHPTHGVCPR